MIAALYVQPNGCYVGIDGVDPWDESRDARNYAGPWPVVAHPPCQRWGALGAASYARWGGEHNRPGNDGGCFGAALSAVRQWGGVLEHPAKSRAWDAYGLPKPHGSGWSGGPREWVCEVWQSAYGHRASKATWLFAVSDERPRELDWRRPRGTHQIGFQDQRGKSRNKPTLPRAEASATPPAFRDALIAVARSSRSRAMELGVWHARVRCWSATVVDGRRSWLGAVVLLPRLARRCPRSAHLTGRAPTMNRGHTQ